MFLFVPPACVEDCTKVLVAPARPVIYEEHKVEVPKKKGDVIVKSCVEWNGECKEVDEKSGFYAVITSEDL